MFRIFTFYIPLQSERASSGIRIYIKENGRYLLAITIAGYDDNEMKKMMLPVSDYMESFPDKSIFHFTITETTPKTLTLFTSVPL